MKLHFRNATIEDVDFLVKLEQEIFPEFQQTSKNNLKKGIKSGFQKVIIVETKKPKTEAIGAAVLFKYKHMLRIYSIGITKEHQNSGIGNQLLEYIKDFALSNHFTSLTLEARAKNTRLIDWYLSHGFILLKTIKDYYQVDEDAHKMGLRIGTANEEPESKNLIVIDQPYTWGNTEIKATVISVRDYINNPLYQNNSNFRIFNLCSSYKYQSYGYYVSLLASARGQRVVPSTSTIKDVQLANVVQSLSFELNDQINRVLYKEKGNSLALDIYFGQSSIKEYKALASKLFQVFEAPLFTVNFVKSEKWIIKSIKVLTLKNLNDYQKEELYHFSQKYFNKKRYNFPKLNNYRYDVAILINPFEEYPPSNKEALNKFRKIANKKGVYVEYINKNDRDKINEFDALFIRETTNVNHYTYELSRLAFAEGLVVIDDPWSILRCSNKIYQHELFKKNKIRTPNTIALTKNMSDDKILEDINYPAVLKQPDSAFSLGVIKVKDKAEAKKELSSLFKKTDMVICQEFLYSDFDWRVGILDNKVIYACKYYMTQNHWQIYNWNSNDQDKSGNHETVSINQVPEPVLNMALKAASLIGDGLYGVDLKFVQDKVYVIEVNDNPNIDAGVEDEILKDELYETIIDSIINRIEIMKNIKHINLINNVPYHSNTRK
ncbi:MAG: GNAT family N-acetyltransferase [Flavobacteriales bacterium]|nr:GNAT family N-acetyltransferase [Flavobacteriales bacterium]